MALDIPADWPPRKWAEDTPLAHLETVATTAPSGGVPRRWEVGSWSTTREISSSLLPGQIRHRTGLSVGTGKALIKRDSEDYPWRQQDVYDLTGSAAQILLAPEGATEIPTGQFRVAPIEGDITTLGVDVDLDERQIRGQTKAANVLGDQWRSQQQFESGIADPSWLVAELAQQMGYGVAVQPGGRLSDGAVYNPILDVPFQGSVSPEYPQGADYLPTSGEWTWRELDGMVAWSPADGEGTAGVRYNIDLGTPPATSTITADVYGRFRLFWQTSTQGYLAVEVQNRTFSAATPETSIRLQVWSAGSNGTANATTALTISNVPPASDRPSGIQIQAEPTISASGVITSWRARVRRGAGSAWSAWVTHPMANTITTSEAMTFNANVQVADGTGVVSPGRVARLSISDGSNTPDELWNNQQGETGQIYLEPLYGEIRSPWLDPDLSVWGAMQAIVSAWQGALITDVYGDLRLLNRYSMTGVGTGAELPIDVGLTFEDLPWQMDYSDQADRLVVKYRPARLIQASPTTTVLPTIWELSELVEVPAGGSKDVFFTLDYVYPVDLQLITFVQKGQPGDMVAHTWDAWTRSDGSGGSHVTPNDWAAIRIDRVTSSTWKIFIRNLSTPAFYMVDNTGTPYLKIRSTYYLDQTQEVTVERGLPSSDAQNALEVDLSNYVQNETDANLLADFLWARVNRRMWKAKTVKMVPDYRLDLGDVVELRHERTHMVSNALVTKVELSGEPGNVTQQVDLVLIPPTWEDFDEAWGPEYETSPPGSWSEFDALWAPYTWNDFDRTPTATTVAEIQEGM